MKFSRLFSLAGILFVLVPCIVFAVEMTAPAVPEMSVGPSLSSITVTDITDTSARIDVNSDEVTQGYVEYGTSEQYGMSTPLTSEFSTSPSFLLENLTPETVYHYRVIVMDSSGAATITGDETFTTLATPSPEPESESPPRNTGTATTTTTTTTTTSSAPALVISNTETASFGTSTATITWQTNKSADSQIEYGITSAYGSFSLIGATSFSHTLTLRSLTPSTKYYYRAISKVSGETTHSSAETFTTLAYTPPASPITTPTSTSTTASSTPVQHATTAPTTTPSLTPPFPNTSTAIVSSAPQLGGLPAIATRPLLVYVHGGDGKVIFSWKKDKGLKNGTINTLIVKKEGKSYIASRIDGTIIYDGPSTNFIDINVENGKEYHYALYSYGQHERFTAPSRFKVIPHIAEKNVVSFDTPQPVAPVFIRDLFMGKRGDDVTLLQTYLAQEGYYPEGLITGYFGTLTKNAVVRYQKLNEITPTMGYVGSITREALAR